MVCCEVIAACVQRSMSDISHYFDMIKCQFQPPPAESDTAPKKEQPEDSENRNSLAILISIHNCCILIPETGWSERVFALTTPQMLFAPSAGSKFFYDAKQLSLCECDLCHMLLLLHQLPALQAIKASLVVYIGY